MFHLIFSVRKSCGSKHEGSFMPLTDFSHKGESFGQAFFRLPVHKKKGAEKRHWEMSHNPGPNLTGKFHIDREEL